MKSLFRGRASRLPLIARTLCLLAASVSQGLAAISINITSPQTNQAVADSLQINASVNSIFEITNVVAEVSGRQTNLTTLGPNSFGGSVSLSGLPRGQKLLVLTATDAFGNTGTAQRNFLLDRPPLIKVIQPEPGLVVRRFIPIKLACVDDDTNCTLVAYVSQVNGIRPIFIATGTNAIETVVDASAYDHNYMVLIANATDSAGQQATSHAVTIVEENPRLIEAAHVRGQLWDFDATRLLFLDSAPGTIRIRDRLTGADTVVGNENRDTGYEDSIGFFTPHGAIFVNDVGIQEWRDGQLLTLASRTTSESVRFFSLTVNGNYAAWSSRIPAVPITVRELVSGTNVLTIPGSLTSLAPSGAVAYTYGGSNYLSTWPTPLGRDDDRGLKSDGTNTIFVASSNGVVNGQSTTFQWLMLFDGATVSQLTPPAATSATFDVNEGWLAFTKVGPSGISQVWRRPPGGVDTQITFFGTSSYLRWLGPEGRLIYTYGQPYRADLVNPDGSTVFLGSNGYWGNQDFYYSEGKLHRVMGGSLFELSTLPRFARFVDMVRTNGTLQFSVIGDPGVTSIVERSTQIGAWQSFSTNTLSPLGVQLSDALSNSNRFYRATLP